jgi:hypothetical protein
MSMDEHVDAALSTDQGAGRTTRAANVDDATSSTSGFDVDARLRPDRPRFAGKSRKPLSSTEGSMYETPKLERLGTLRELTRAGGDFTPGDGVNPYHRYSP